MPLSAEVRSAQRAIGGSIRAGGAHLTREHLGFWRSRNAGEWMTSADEITAYLEILEVPYVVAVCRGRTKTTQRELGFEVRVAWDDLPILERWVPALSRLRAAVEATRPEKS